MKKLILIALTAVSGYLGHAQVCVETDYTSTDVTRQKYGFLNFISDPTCPGIPHYYADCNYTANEWVNTIGNNTLTVSSVNTNGSVILTSVSGTATYNNGNSASASLSSGWTSPDFPDWSAGVGYNYSGLDGCTGDGDDPTYSMYFSMCIPDTDFSVWDFGTGTNEETIDTDTWGITLSTNEFDDEPIAATSTHTETLSSEVPTSILFQNFPSASDDWNEGGGETAASAEIAGTEDEAWFTGVRVRFKVTATGNFLLGYLTDYNIGGIDFLSTNYLSGTGTGTPQYYPSDEGLVINPPYAYWMDGACPAYLGGSASVALLGTICILDGKDKGCQNIEDCHCGMPVWWVSEPFINLWVADKPDEYSTSLGEKEAFAVYYKQNDNHGQQVDGESPFMPSTGWNNNWSSYVHITGSVITNSDGSLGNDFTNWSAQVFERGGGETDFAAGQTQDTDSGEQLLPMDGVNPRDNAGVYGGTGFRLVHPDGSQDIYGSLTTLYPTNSPITMPVFENGNSTDVPVGTRDGLHFATSWWYTPVVVSTNPALTNVVGGVVSVGPGATTNVIWGYYTNMTVSMPMPPAVDALMTEHIDPYGNSTHLYYTTNLAGAYFLTSIVDYDGKTTTINYDGSGMLESVSMPYGHTSYFSCNTNAQILSITDAQGMTSSFGYDISNNLSTITTPYGTNSFSTYDANPNNISLVASGLERAIMIINPDTSRELYAYFNSDTNCAPAKYTGTLPTASGVYFDSGSTNNPAGTLDCRDSFYWGRAQCASLSTTVPVFLNTLTSNDFNLGRMKHWMLVSDGYGGDVLSTVVSVEREPSPDGTTPGQMIWYSSDAPGGTPWELEPGSLEEANGAYQLFPNGSTYSEVYSYDSYGQYRGSTTYNSLDGAGDTKLAYNFGGTTYNYSCTAGSLHVGPVTWNAETLSQVSGVEVPRHSISFNTDYTQTNTESFTNLGTTSTLSLTTPAPPDLIYDAGGNQWTVSYNNRSQVSGYTLGTGLVVTNYYDANNFLSESIAPQISATNTYVFSDGLPLSWTDPLGRTTGYTWDGLERLTGIAYPDGTTVSNVYTNLDLVAQKDRLGYWTYAQYDNMRQKIWSSDKNGNVTQYGYCVCGGLDSIIDPMSNSITLDREMDGRVMTAAFADAGADTITWTLGRNAIGEMTNLTDSTGINLQYAYDGIGRMTGVTCGGTNIYGASMNSYDEPAYETNADGSAVQDNYDGAGRLQTRQQLTDGVTWTAIYDKDAYPYPQNHLLDYSTYGSLSTSFNPAGWVTNFNGPGGTRSYTYNAMGQIQSMTDGDGHVTTWAYDKYGNNISKTDGNRVVEETNGYDGGGREVAHWTPAMGLTRYTWDGNGNVTSVSNAGGTNTYAYDALNRLSGMSDGLGSSTFGYRSFGAFMSALSSEEGPWSSEGVSNGYTGWERGSMTLAEPAGNWTESYTYDSLMRLTGVSSGAGSFGYSYDGLGQEVTGISLPGGSSITNTYDSGGLELSTALKHSTSVLDSYTYTYESALRTSVTRADGSYVDYGYGGYGELTSAVGYETGGSTQRENENLYYSYDNAWNLEERENDTLYQGFGVDGANELTNVSQDTDYGTTMTVVGNLSNSVTGLKINGQAAGIYGDETFAAGWVTLNDGLNLFTNVLTVSGHSYTNVLARNLPAETTLLYDANGNVVSDGLKGYGYDYANELTSVTETNEWKNTYAYDGLGRRRIARNYLWESGEWVEAVEKHYIYDGNEVVQERDGANNPLVSYTRGLDMGGGIGGLLARTDVKGSGYYHADGNGNITAMVNGSGALAAKYLYDPYGNMLGMWGSLAPINMYRYSSKEMDLQSGLYYFGYRYYDPNFQRWLNQDPIGENGGINLYRAMNNNPVNYIDPYGLLGWSDFNPSLLWNGQAWSQLGSDIFMGNTSQAVDPNSYQALMQNNGTPLLSPLTDQNGNQLGNPASAVGGAVVGGIADAASLMAGGGEAKGAIKCEKAAANWLWPQGKGVAKMLRQMEQRGWTPQQITEAIEKGQQFAAQNLVNPGNPAIRYVNPTTGQSVVVDTVTHEVIHVGGPGFKY